LVDHIPRDIGSRLCPLSGGSKKLLLHQWLLTPPVVNRAETWPKSGKFGLEFLSLQNVSWNHTKGKIVSLYVEIYFPFITNHYLPCGFILRCFSKSDILTASLIGHMTPRLPYGWHVNHGLPQSPHQVWQLSDTLTNPMINWVFLKMDTKRDHKFDHVQSRINQFRFFSSFSFLLIVFCALCIIVSCFAHVFPVFDAKKSSDSLGATEPRPPPAEPSTPEPVPDHLAQESLESLETVERYMKDNNR